VPLYETQAGLLPFACATYVATGTGLLAMWAFGSRGWADNTPAAAPWMGRDASSLANVETFQERARRKEGRQASSL